MESDGGDLGISRLTPVVINAVKNAIFDVSGARSGRCTQ